MQVHANMLTFSQIQNGSLWDLRDKKQPGLPSSLDPDFAASLKLLFVEHYMADSVQKLFTDIFLFNLCHTGYLRSRSWHQFADKQATVTGSFKDSQLVYTRFRIHIHFSPAPKSCFYPPPLICTVVATGKVPSHFPKNRFTGLGRQPDRLDDLLLLLKSHLVPRPSSTLPRPPCPVPPKGLPVVLTWSGTWQNNLALAVLGADILMQSLLKYSSLLCILPAFEWFVNSSLE